MLEHSVRTSDIEEILGDVPLLGVVVAEEDGRSDDVLVQDGGGTRVVREALEQALLINVRVAVPGSTDGLKPAAEDRVDDTRSVVVDVLQSDGSVDGHDQRLAGGHGSASFLNSTVPTTYPHPVEAPVISPRKPLDALLAESYQNATASSSVNSIYNGIYPGSGTGLGMTTTFPFVGGQITQPFVAPESPRERVLRLRIEIAVLQAELEILEEHLCYVIAEEA